MDTIVRGSIFVSIDPLVMVVQTEDGYGDLLDLSGYVSLVLNDAHLDGLTDFMLSRALLGGSAN